MTMHRFRFNKLVRDKTLERVRDRNFTIDYRILEHAEYVKCLKEKLREESREVQETTNPDELREELADVLEVIHGLIKVSGFTYEAIEKVRLEKREERGGFDKKIFGMTIDIESTNPFIDYYFKRPTEYPEEPIESDTE